MQPFKRSFQVLFCSFAILAAGLAVTNVAFAQTKAKAIEDSDEDAPAAPSKRSMRSSVSPSSKFMNIRISPLGLLISYINFDFDFKVSDQWTVGPTLTYWSYTYESSLYTNNIKVDTTAFGARATWAKNGAFKDGLYVSPMIQFVSAKASGRSAYSGNNISANGTQTIVTGLIGYQWFFTESFNLNLGGGIALGASGSKVDVTDGTTTTSVDTTRTGGLAVDFMLGYAF